MSAPPTAISSTPISAGSFPACAWPRTLSWIETRQVRRPRLPRRRARRPRRADPGDPGALALRPARLGIVRGDHPPSRILSDPHRDGPARALLRRGRGDARHGPRRWSSSARARRPRRRSCFARVHPSAYVPIDIQGDFLRESAAALRADVSGPAGPPGRGRFHAAARSAGRDRRRAQARLLPRLDDRQHGRRAPRSTCSGR